MPDNTITSTANNTLQQLDIGQQRERREANAATEDGNNQPQQNTQAAQSDVEVELSQEARDLSLSNAQQLTAPNAAAETQASETTTQAAPTQDNSNAEATLAAQEEAEDAPPPRENANQITRRFDQSANEALGTVIDIRS